MSNVINKALAPHLKDASQKFNALPEKDQRALIVLSVFAAVVIFVFAIFIPAQEFHDRALRDMGNEQELYQWLKSKESQVKSQPKQTKTSSTNQSLLTIVTASSKDNGLNLKRVQPEGSKRIRLWLEDAPFNRILMSFDQLQNQYGLSIEEISIDRKAAGQADARATISR